MSSKQLKKFSSFNGYPKAQCYLQEPTDYNDFKPSSGKQIARGQGLSYGDAALNQGEILISTTALNRCLMFDQNQGVLTLEAGTTLAQILALIVPAGWFLPVTPGTHWASVGGCIAADVHGKNHLRQGSFSEAVLWFELYAANGEKYICSREQNSDLFWATVGGLGLTGLIGQVGLRLLPISSVFLHTLRQRTTDLAATLSILTDLPPHYAYQVAWLDGCARNKHLGRGIVSVSNFAEAATLPLSLRSQPLPSLPRKSIFTVPAYFPRQIINPYTLQLFNQAYYWHAPLQPKHSLLTYPQFFYPLDRLSHWPRCYGKRGFVQYQCVVPYERAEGIIAQLLKTAQQQNYWPYLVVAKCLGQENTGLLSFPQSGITLAMDIPFYNAGVFAMLDRFDEWVLQAQGRVYLAKDFRLSARMFQAMYPRYLAWAKIKKQIDPLGCFSSSLSRRLQL